MAGKYLFIRILEACNAGCFMCAFAHSKDTSRFTPGDLRQLLPSAQTIGVRFVRYTGGEPLLHEAIAELVRIPAAAGFQVSLITNGYFLPDRADELARCGLRQIIVSLDGATGKTHDRYRRTEGLFARALEGLRRCRSIGLLLRVNSVVGPHNYGEMLELQALLADEGVTQWELSALKMARPVRYSDRAGVLAVGRILYEGSSPLKPMGVPWYGASEDAQLDYFVHGIPPRPSGPQCRVTQDVIYLDARTRQLFVCSCLPHRRTVMSFGARLEEEGQIESAALRQQREWYFKNGPRVCTGCSSTAAAYGDAATGHVASEDWSY
jgi:cytosylglucuronate decarboxylase